MYAHSSSLTHFSRTRVQFSHPLVAEFALVLSYCLEEPIAKKWHGNKALQDAINGLDSTQAAALLKKALASNKSGKSKFIEDYVNFVNDKGLIEGALNLAQADLAKNPKSSYSKNKIKVLEQRLERMQREDAGDYSGPVGPIGFLAPYNPFELDDQPMSVDSTGSITNSLTTTIDKESKEPSARELMQARFDELNDVDARMNYLINQTNTFTEALKDRSKNLDIIVEMYQWELLRKWFMGEAVNVGTSTHPNLRSNSPQQVLDNFVAAVSRRCSGIIFTFWNSNASIKSIFLDVQANAHGNRIGMDVLRKLLEHIFHSKLPTVALEIMESRPDFIEWLKTESPELTSPQLINFFRNALVIRSFRIIKLIFKDNDFLRRTILDLSLSNATLIMKEMLKCSRGRRVRFTSEYIDLIDNRTIIKECVREIAMKYKDLPMPELIKNQVAYLENWLQCPHRQELLSNFETQIKAGKLDKIRGLWGNVHGQLYYAVRSMNAAQAESLQAVIKSHLDVADQQKLPGLVEALASVNGMEDIDENTPPNTNSSSLKKLTCV